MTCHITAGTVHPMPFTQPDAKHARRRLLYELRWQHIAAATPPALPDPPPTATPATVQGRTQDARPGPSNWVAGQIVAYDAKGTGVTVLATFRGRIFPASPRTCQVTMQNGRDATVECTVEMHR